MMVTNLGLLGTAIYGAIFIDQHSFRSHPNKAVDIVCQTFWIALGSHQLLFVLGFLSSEVACNRSARSLSPGRLRCRCYRPRHGMAQRFIHLSAHPQSVQ